MKVKQLIAELTAEDPNGTILIGNDPVVYIAKQSDTPYYTLIQDESLKPYYNITGLRFYSQGDRLELETYCYQDSTIPVTNKTEVTDSTTQGLIQMLKQFDPTGELEVLFNGAPIYSIANLPSYYDGRLQELIRDEEGHIIGIREAIGHANKIRINTSDYETVIFGNSPSITLEYMDDRARDHYQRLVERARQEGDEIKQDVEAMSFSDYVMTTLNLERLPPRRSEGLIDIRLQPCTRIERQARDWFLANRRYDEPLEAINPYESIHSTRCRQWDRELTIEVIDGNLKISSK